MGYDRHECYSIGEGELKMSGRYPEIVYTEEGMREGMQIEDANIPIDAKVALLDALSERPASSASWLAPLSVRVTPRRWPASMNSCRSSIPKQASPTRRSP